MINEYWLMSYSYLLIVVELLQIVVNTVHFYGNEMIIDVINSLKPSNPYVTAEFDI